MTQPEVRATIDAYGNVKVDAIGFVGGTCREVTSPILLALGGAKKGDCDKPEAFQSAGATVSNRW